MYLTVVTCMLYFCRKIARDLTEGQMHGGLMEDCNGHGTHVAGIIAGNDNVIQGVAPEAQLGVYRVAGCNSDVNELDLVAGLEAAFQDGMQVINISIGSLRLGHNVAEQAIDRLKSSQVIVIRSAGNVCLHHMSSVHRIYPLSLPISHSRQG